MTNQMPNWLRQRAYLTPRQNALIYAGQRWTFAELQALVDATAQRLLAQGFAAGEPIAVLMSATPEYVVMVHAISRIQAVLVPLNTRLSAPELAWQLNNANVVHLVADGTHADVAETLQKELSTLQITLVTDLVDVSASSAYPPVASLPNRLDLDAPFGILYTSGTTGHPKGAVITYGNIWWSAMGSALNLSVTPGDCWLACLPLFHIGGLSILMRSVIYGIPVCLHSRFNPAEANSAIDQNGVTIVSVVSAMLQRMLAERQGAPYPATFRCMLLGGGPAPRPLLESCAALGVPVAQTYGLTETASQAATLSPEDALRKLGSAGKPLFPTELQIRLDGLPAQTGQAGEIIVRGPTVSPGYLQAKGAPLRPCADSEGWLHTGDVGYLDADGYLYVLDRRDDLIISGGENVYPAEVEAVLLAHPAVLDAGVKGVPDTEWGQIPAACVVLRPGEQVAEADLLRFCRKRLAGYKTPHYVRIVDSLPRTASGKLQRRLLPV